MRIHKASRILILTVILLTCLNLSAALFTRHLLELRRHAAETWIEALHAGSQLARGSEVLTRAVRAYAATGDPGHWQAYLTEAKETRTRDLAIERLRRLGLTEQELGLFEEAKRNSDALIALEFQVASAVESGDLRRAVQRVHGPDYEHAKRHIMDPIQAAIEHIEQRLMARRAAISQTASTYEALSIGLHLVTALFVAWALVYFFQGRVVEPIRRLTDKAMHLLAGDAGTRFGGEDDESEIGDLARTLENYRIQAELVARQRWAKEALAGLTLHMQHSFDSSAAFAERLLNGLTALLPNHAAALHVRASATEAFERIGGYGELARSRDSGELAARQQCHAEAVRSGRPVWLDGVPLGQGSPEPGAMAQGRVRVSVEHGYMAALLEFIIDHIPDPRQVELLNDLPAVVGPMITVHLRTRQTQELLDSTMQIGRASCRERVS
jgi:HAMP domain-containing protein